MENNNNKYARFNSTLNKTIVLSSKQFYEREVARDFNELKILDDENYEEYLKEYVKCDGITYNAKNENDFINSCNHTGLVCALKSLSNIEKAVIFLLFEERLTSSEASKILKICSDSVTRINRRAIRKLAKYLKGDK